MKQKKTNMGSAVLAVFMAAVVLVPGLTRAGDLEPSGPPGPTMKTMDQILPAWSRTIVGPERFELVMGGDAVLGKETGLTWTRDANLDEDKTWFDAVYSCRNLTIGNRMGWRLPTVEELSTLLDLSQPAPKLPQGHPFINVKFSKYWSSTPYEGLSSYAWAVSTSDVPVSTNIDKSSPSYVWPVRGGSN